MAALSQQLPLRLRKAGNGNHFEQACNAQAAVDEAMWIVGERVSVAPNDQQELAPGVAPISPVVVQEVKAVLMDSGFYREAAVRAVEQKPEGGASGLTVYAAVEKHSHHQTIADLLPQPEPAAPGPDEIDPVFLDHWLRWIFWCLLRACSMNERCKKPERTDSKMKAKRRRFDPAFKAKIGLEALKGIKTVAEIAREYQVHPNQVSQWKRPERWWAWMDGAGVWTTCSWSDCGAA